jgi:PAS domain S-box-containing protein
MALACARHPDHDGNVVLPGARHCSLSHTNAPATGRIGAMGETKIRGRRVGVELAILVMIVAVPLAGMIAYLLYDTAHRDEQHAAGLAMQMAVTTADRAERYIEATRKALEALAKRPLIRAMDLDRCDPQLADLNELYGRPANIVVIDLQGRIICGATMPPRNVVLLTADEEMLRAMKAKPGFRLSKPIIGRISKRWTVAVAQPVFSPSGELAGIVAVGIDLQNWVSFSSIAGEPKGTVHDVVTAEGIVIARSAEAEAWIGRNAGGSEVHRRMLEMKQGTVRARGTEGADRLWGFTPVPHTDWFARSSVSANRVFGPVRERTAQTFIVLAIVLAIAFAAVVISVARLVRPMQTIAAAVRSRTGGRGDVRVPVAGPREVAELAAELNRMIDTGERRDEDLRRFRAAMDISGDAILLIDRATLRYVDVNQTFCEMLGYSRQEILGKTPMDVFSADRATLERDYDALMADKHSSANVVEGAYRRKDGTQVPVEARRRAVHTEHGWIIVATATDITQRKRAEEYLRQSEERFRRTFEIAGSGVAHIGLDRRFLRVNRRLCDILGYPERELIGLTGREISHPDDLDVINRQRPILYAGEIDAVRVEKRYVRKDGSIVWVAFTMTVERDEAGQAMYEIAIFDDITSRKEAEAALRAAHDELTRSNSELEQFAYVASHDLQEPLRMVASYTQLLGRRYGDRLEGDAKEFMAYIVDGAARMKQLIEDLLAYSRVGTRGKEFKPVRLEAVVERARTNLRAALGESGGAITHDALPEVEGDELQLTQLLQNLAGNALKFRAEAKPVIHISSIEREHEFEITVRDNGIGIEAQYFERIFMVFQRLHDKGQYPGTGIGLAICKKVADRHGGRLWVESAPGQGSAFKFTLPKAGHRHPNTSQ